MANLYNGYNYGMNNGYMGAQTPVGQPVSQTVPTPQIPTPSACTMQVVNRYEEAVNSWVPPGYTTFFINFNDMQMYIKQNDSSNIPSPIRIFDLSERTKVVEQTNQQNQNVVTREEFEDLKNTILAALTPQQSSVPMNDNGSQQQNRNQKNGRRSRNNE